MGDPRKLKKKYSGPTHPWQKERIEYEKQLIREYGLKNKKEVWKANSLLKKFKAQAKKLTASSGENRAKKEEELLKSLQRKGLLKENPKLDDVLALTIKDILERRLQTALIRSKLALSPKQARQLITHNHITVNDKKITSPSYILLINDKINYSKNSPFANLKHPEVLKLKKKEEIRIKKEAKAEEVKKEEKVKKEAKAKESKEEGKAEEENKEVKAKERKEEVKEIKPKTVIKDQEKEIKGKRIKKRISKKQTETIEAQQ